MEKEQIINEEPKLAEPDIEKARRIISEHQEELEKENEARNAKEHSVLSIDFGTI